MRRLLWAIFVFLIVCCAVVFCSNAHAYKLVFKVGSQWVAIEVEEGFEIDDLHLHDGNTECRCRCFDYDDEEGGDDETVQLLQERDYRELLRDRD